MKLWRRRYAPINLLRKFAKRSKTTAVSALRNGVHRLVILPATSVLRQVGPSAWKQPVRWQFNVLRRLGKHEEALVLLEQADGAIAQSERISSDVAELLAAAGRHEDAAECWRRTILASSVDARCWRQYAELLGRLGLHDEIDRMLDRCAAASSSCTKTALLACELARKLSPQSFDRIANTAVQVVGGHDKGLEKLTILHGKIGNLGLAAEYLDSIGPSRRKPKRVRKLTRRIQHVVETLTEFDGMPASTHDLRTPEDPLKTLLNLRTTAPVGARSGLSMTVTTLGPGGAERQLTNTVNGLRQHDLCHDIKIVQTRSRNDDVDGFYQSQFTGSTLPITTVNDRPIDIDLVASTLGDHVRSLLPLLPKSSETYIGRYLTEFVRTRPEVVHCWSDQRNITAGVAAVIAGVPRVILSTRSIAPPGNRPTPRFSRAVYRALLACPEVRMINNSLAGAKTYEDWLGLPEGTIGVVHNGIDIDQLHSSRDPEKTKANREQLGLGPNVRVVGSLFRFSTEKRPRLWLEAAAQLAAIDDKVQFVLIGDGAECDRAKDFSQELGIADRVHFLGLIKDVVPWYDVMDAVLLTSSREGTSNTALEAQALGKPIVVPNVGGMGETMVQGRSGFLLDADPSPQSIAERIAFVLGDPAWRQEAADAGEAFIRARFSIERMSKDTFALYELSESLRKSA